MTQIALITGASRGLGAAIALALAPTHHIVAVARTIGGLEELDDRIRALGGTATLAPMDVTVDEAMATLCRGIHDRWGKVDVWAHAAIHAAPPFSPARMCSSEVDTLPSHSIEVREIFWFKERDVLWFGVPAVLRGTLHV